ncbi:MAG: hypothetical protein HN948_04335 [Clostridia bacterium]|jgi:hypothetical protein|nr:hypothetical protein [Clostridia bacterium]MBT7122224.1 hypothetical protein [Clostridia bacterium]
MSNFYETELDGLFNQARDNGRIEFIYTLVRVSGMGEGEDNLISLKLGLDKLDKNEVKNIAFFNTCKLALSSDIFLVLVNLINCSNKRFFDCNPFFHLLRKDSLELIEATPFEIVCELVNIIKKTDKVKLQQIMEKVFNQDVLDYLQSDFSFEKSKELEGALKELREFIKVFIDLYFEMRLKYKNNQRLFKRQNFEVIELLIDEVYRLNGFKMYFSNGTSAHYIRNLENTTCSNVFSGKTVSFYLGNVSELKKEYMVENKRLYEIGLPGKFNKHGEWKPLFFPGDSEQFIKEAKLVSEDQDVQGIYFYMLCTGHRVIEFIVRTTLEIPLEFTHLGEKFHLYKCLKENNEKSSNSTIQIYDGWVELETGSIQEIETQLNGIRYALNVIGFTYRVSIDWRTKYKIAENMEALAIPTNDDLTILDMVLKEMSSDEKEVFVLSYALDWYVKGRTTKNILISFLSYYIALESVASAIARGDVVFGLNYQSENKGLRKERREKGIQDLHEQFYESNPIRFVQEAYLKYVTSITGNTKKIAELVLGENSEEVQLLFDKTGDNEPSLHQIRGKIAHGDIALLLKKDVDLVMKHLHEIRSISWKFLMRIILKLQPTENLPTWSNTYKSEYNMADPRSTLCYSNESLLPKEVVWNIKSEWFD